MTQSSEKIGRIPRFRHPKVQKPGECSSALAASRPRSQDRNRAPAGLRPRPLCRDSNCASADECVATPSTKSSATPEPQCRRRPYLNLLLGQRPGLLGHEVSLLLALGLTCSCDCIALLVTHCGEGCTHTKGWRMILAEEMYSRAISMKRSFYFIRARCIDDADCAMRHEFYQV